MATISKFYLHDAATGNTGTMPTGAFANSGDVTGDATGARTARATSDIIGALQASGAFASNADQTSQHWGMRRFVSAPLAAQTILFSSTSWTFSGARSESSTSHNQALALTVYCWTPETGAVVGLTNTNRVVFQPSAPASTAELTFSVAPSAGTDIAISDGDILVFEVSDNFIQSKSTSFTSTFFYDGTTEASATSCASFVTPPAALTLFTASPVLLPFPHQSVPFYPTPSRPS